MGVKRLLLLLLAASCSMPLHAGFCSPAADDPRHQFVLFAGYSPASATLIGTETNRRFAVAGFSYEYRCWIWNTASLSYSGTVMPAAILVQPQEVVHTFFPPFAYTAPPHAVYGFAIAPMGFTLDLWRARRVHPFLETVEGIIASTEPIPENQPGATGLNFMFDFGGGVQWSLSPRRAVSFGYRFLHISNAGTTNFNPGLDNNVIYVGFSFFR